MNEAESPPGDADQRLAELETGVRAWARPFGHRVRRCHGAVPLWGVDDAGPYLCVDLLDGRDDVVAVIPLDDGGLVVGVVNGPSGICRAWECGPGRLLEVLQEADAHSRSATDFAAGGLC